MIRNRDSERHVVDDGNSREKKADRWVMEGGEKCQNHLTKCSITGTKE